MNVKSPYVGNGPGRRLIAAQVKRIQELRRNGVTNNQIAERLGIHIGHVQRLTKGIR